MIDDVEKWNDLDELKKANPNMGVSVKESFFVDEIAVAEGSLVKKQSSLQSIAISSRTALLHGWNIRQ